MFNQRKGITPVIAIVLLLLVTVGAVGVVYTQFQSIVDQGNTQASYLDEVDAKITVIQRNASSPEPDQMQIVLENTGSDEYNLTDIARLEYSVPGEQTLRPDSTAGNELFGYEFNETERSCFNQTSGLQSFAPGDVKSCNTGLEMPSPDEEMTVQLTKTATESNSVIDDYNCSPSTSSSSTC